MRLIASILFMVFIFSSSNVKAIERYNITTKISSILIYPQPVTPNGVVYTELLISIPSDMAVKPACAAHSTRFIIDSNNPMFPYVYGIALQAKKEGLAININYWKQCEKSGTHRAPLIRAVSL